MALKGYNAAVKAQSSSIVFTDEATTTTDDQNYVITDTAKRIIALDATVVVEDGGVPTTEDYTLSRLANNDINVTFGTVDAGRVITITGEYVVLSTITTASGFTFSGSADSLEITPFNQTGFREYQAGLVTATADLSRFFATDSFFINMLLNSEIKVIEYYPDSTGDPIRFFGLLTSDNVESPVDNVITETLTFQVTNEINSGV